MVVRLKAATGTVGGRGKTGRDDRLINLAETETTENEWGENILMNSKINKKKIIVPQRTIYL